MQFPHYEPTALATLPASTDVQANARHLKKLRRRARDINDVDITGFDPEAPAIWLVSRGVAYILLVAGSWEHRVFTRTRGWINKEATVIDHDPSRTLRSWIDEEWPRITSESSRCLVEVTRSGRSNDRFIARMLAAPSFETDAASQTWGRWNGQLASSMRADELHVPGEAASERDCTAPETEADRAAKEQAFEDWANELWAKQEGPQENATD